MSSTQPSESSSALPSGVTGVPVTPDRWVSEVSSLLRALEQATAGADPPAIAEMADNQLVQVRLGIAGSLFSALRCKYAPSAAHALRVALTASAWALREGLSETDRDALELAALLHDIGVIGVPDHVLLKPGPLDREEMAVMECSRDMSLEILRGCCAAEDVLVTVENVGAWYDGSRSGFRLAGKELPQGARMLAIVEAFDAMTTDRVYRPAMSQERAMAELFRNAGTQFDARLTARFAELHMGDQGELRREVAQRWLHSLDPEMANSYWQLNNLQRQTGQPDVQSLFQVQLLASMHDAVVFVDRQLQVTLWNHGAERLTGITAESIYRRAWSPEILNIRDEKGDAIDESDCPVACAARSGVQSLRRLTIMGRTGRLLAADAHVIPVATEDGTPQGAILILHDASSEISLEQRCHNLHEKATLDPLTQVGNRAEFDRVHELFIASHLQQQIPCSLIICDLDLFKKVNDTYGHQAGDEAIKSLANLLKNSSRPGDLVARYGGEEFVLLCANCDNATAARRAEHVRKALAQLQQPKMEGRTISASFGVTEIQPGDTPETMLRRSDRALLMAKERGRNMVVQLGTGSDATDAAESGWGFWDRKSAKPKSDTILQRDLVTPVPVKIAIEKLRGFVADHCASIVKIEGSLVQLQIADRKARSTRRHEDRSLVFLVDLRFDEEQVRSAHPQESTGTATQTRIHVSITPKKSRDRRRGDADNRAREVLASFRSYLMASDADDAPPAGGVLRKAGQLLTPWLMKR